MLNQVREDSYISKEIDKNMAEIIDNHLGFEFAIDNVENTSMSNGENAFIIYLIVDNKTSKSRKLNLKMATYVNKNREQFEQDIWLSGYIMGEDTIKPNSFKKAGLVFYKSKLKDMLEGDLLYISLDLIQEDVSINLSFYKNVDKWFLFDSEKIEAEIQLSPKQLGKRLLKRIRRFDAFEERLGIYFDKISVKVNDDLSLVIFFEVHSNKVTDIKCDLRVFCVLYNLEDTILEQENIILISKDFYGFAIEEINFHDVNATDVNTIRIYPQKY